MSTPSVRAYAARDLAELTELPLVIRRLAVFREDDPHHHRERHRGSALLPPPPPPPG